MAKRTWGVNQFADELGLSRGVFARALRLGEIPPADSRAGYRSLWSEDIVSAARARIEEIRARVGSIDDLGAFRAAEILTERFGRDIDPGTVEELARTGKIPQVGEYKGHPLYCGLTLERFADTDALAKAERDGKLFTLDEAADHLDVRTVDLRHLLKAGWLEPTKYVRSSWQARSALPKVPLFTATALDAIAEHPALDWAAVRATPPGRPSPLASLARVTPERSR